MTESDTQEESAKVETAQLGDHEQKPKPKPKGTTVQFKIAGVSDQFLSRIVRALEKMSKYGKVDVKVGGGETPLDGQVDHRSIHNAVTAIEIDSNRVFRRNFIHSGNAPGLH